jgi:hypothetical protein
MNELEGTRTAVARRTVVETTMVALPLDVQIATADSIIRARFGELTRNRTQPALQAAPGTPPPIPAPVARAAAAGSAATGARRLVMMSAPRTPLTPDLAALNELATKELARRVSGGGDWVIVVPEQVSERGVREAAVEGADGLVMVSLVPSAGDSVDLRVSVRSLAPGSSFGYNFVSSEHIYRPTTLEPFRLTMEKAAKLIDGLKRLPAGGNWQMDLGRDRRTFDSTSGRRGGGGPRDGFPFDSTRLKVIKP